MILTAYPEMFHGLLVAWLYIASEQQISFRVNWVFMQPGYPQSATCKTIACFLVNEAIGNLSAYLFTLLVCFSKVAN